MTTTATKKTNSGDDDGAVEKKPQSEQPERPLEELILNRSYGKYQVVELISFHAKCLRGQEELRHLTQTEILERAMRDVLSGAVSEEELAKQVLAAPPPSRKDAEKPARKK